MGVFSLHHQCVDATVRSIHPVQRGWSNPSGFSPNFTQTLCKCLKRLNTRKICSHNARNKSLDVASSEDSNRSSWALGRFFSCATTSGARQKPNVVIARERRRASSSTCPQQG